MFSFSIVLVCNLPLRAIKSPFLQNVVAVSARPAQRVQSIKSLSYSPFGFLKDLGTATVIFVTLFLYF